MTPYTPSEIHTLMANVNCHRDIVEISDYLADNKKKYAINMLINWVEDITLLMRLFRKTG